MCRTFTPNKGCFFSLYLISIKASQSIKFYEQNCSYKCKTFISNSNLGCLQVRSGYQRRGDENYARFRFKSRAVRRWRLRESLGRYQTTDAPSAHRRPDLCCAVHAPSAHWTSSSAVETNI